MTTPKKNTTKRTNVNRRGTSGNRTSGTSSGSRTSGTVRKSSISSKKRTTSAKRKSSKNRVYIPADKIILMCGCVVVFCTILLVLAQTLGGKADKNAGRLKDEKPAVEKVEKINSSKEGKTSKAAKESKVTDNSKDSKSKKDKKNAEEKTKTVAEEKKSSVEQKKTDTVKERLVEGENISKTGAEKAYSVEKASSKSVEVPPSQPKLPSSSDFSYLPPAENGATLIFVFDDGGQNLNHLEKFVTLPFPVTVAVLPRLQYSRASGERVRKSGNELILHQPMQAVNEKVNPGAGAILPGMSEDEVRTILFENIYEVGPVTGVNNHEGSLITADAEKMSWVLKFLSDEGLFFLDSRTNVETKVPYVAKALGYSFYQRNVFLDNTKKRSDIIAEIEKGLKIANRTGNAVMIGHVWSAEVLPGILTEMYPVLQKKGYKFATLSESGAETF